MLVYYPQIYPDELMYSYFARCHIYSGNINHHISFMNLYNKRSDTPSQEFIGNLNNDIINILDKIYGMENLVLNHTMFPYYARFLPLNDKINALHMISYDNCDTKKLLSILPRKINVFKFCPLCKKEDIENYGETYWHRTHQIRNISICTKHKCKLIESDISIIGSSYKFYTAQEFTKDDTIIIEDNKSIIAFCKYLEEIFLNPMDLSNDIPINIILCKYFRNSIYQKGMQRHISKFCDDMYNFYKNLELNEIPTINQINKTMLIGDRYDFNTVVLIAYFISMSKNDLLNTNLTSKEIFKEQKSHYIKQINNIDYNLLDKKLYNKAKVFIEDVYYSKDRVPRKISKAGLCKYLNISLSELKKLHNIYDLYLKYKETDNTYRIRKIKWSFNKLEGKENIYWSDIRRLSGIKKEYVIEILPYLDVELQDKLRNLI